MKTTLISILIALISITASGQISLEQSYSHSGTLAEIEDDVYKYFVMDVPLNQVRLYNEDHSLYKTINLTVPSGYWLYDVKFVSTHTFNSDDNIELLYIYQKTEVVNSTTVYRYGLRVISESGAQLLKLDDGGFAEIKKFDDVEKLLAYRYIWSSSYYLVYTDVYALKTGGTKAVESSSSEELILYPNPVQEGLPLMIKQTSLPPNSTYQINNIKGQIVEHGIIPEGATSHSLQLDNLPAGSYILNISSDKQIISTAKFEKQ